MTARTRAIITATVTLVLVGSVALLAGADRMPSTQTQVRTIQHSARPTRAPRPSAQTIPLGRTPARVRRFCAALSRRGIPVLCPSLWPRHDGRVQDGRNLVLPGLQSYLG